MKAILEFDLPEEQYEFDSAVNGCQWHSLVFDLDEKLRQDIKHQRFGDTTRVAGVEVQLLSAPYEQALKHIRKYILDETLDRGLKLHE
tara:strand:- start:268 stop:531 length:264 start_codon:yes stop_codon:yes gene_type:complete